jgi:hypothetical protein
MATSRQRVGQNLNAMKQLNEQYHKNPKDAEALFFLASELLVQSYTEDFDELNSLRKQNEAYKSELDERGDRVVVDMEWVKELENDVERLEKQNKHLSEVVGLLARRGHGSVLPPPVILPPPQGKPIIKRALPLPPLDPQRTPRVEKTSQNDCHDQLLRSI